MFLGSFVRICKDKYVCFFAGSKAGRDYYLAYMQTIDTLKLSIVQTICPIMTAKPTSTVHVSSEPYISEPFMQSQKEN